MPVIDNRNQPLPPDHPFARPLIAFGQRRPGSSASSLPAEKPSTPDPMEDAQELMDKQLGELRRG